MADTKISALTAATTLADTDELVIASAGASKKITGANLKASIAAGGSAVGTQLDYAQITANVTFGAGPAAIITGNPITLDGSTRICIEVFCTYVVCPATSAGSLDLKEGSTALGTIAGFYNATAVEVDFPIYAAVYRTPAAGTYTYALVGYKNVGSNITFRSGAAGTANSPLPAYLRVSKA